MAKRFNSRKYRSNARRPSRKEGPVAQALRLTREAQKRGRPVPRATWAGVLPQNPREAGSFRRALAGSGVHRLEFRRDGAKVAGVLTSSRLTWADIRRLGRGRSFALEGDALIISLYGLGRGALSPRRSQGKSTPGRPKSARF